jgi:hypothetical protein
MSILHGPAAMKVTADHLRRNAYLYVRQSTLRQVLTNTEVRIILSGNGGPALDLVEPGGAGRRPRNLREGETNR